MSTRLLADWTKPQIDAACSAAHGRYATDLAIHYTRYFEAYPKLSGAPSLYRSQYGPGPETSEGAMVDTCEKALHTLGAP